MKLLLAVITLILIFAAPPLAAQDLLFSNGPFVTHPGGGPGGSDYSLLSDPLVNYGFGNQVSAGNRVSDDFTVTGEGWIIDSVVFFQYQTGSSLISTFTATNIIIWKGATVVWGDASTNRLQRSVWTGCYRGDDLYSTDRPVMRNTCATPSLTLSPGIYEIDWQADGSLGSGPWCIPVTITGQSNTGNAIGFSDGSWSPLYGDTLDSQPQGLPFLIYGRVKGSYPSNITINVNYTFADPYNLSSYRIAGLPGQTGIPLAGVIPGEANKNWTAFWDNGNDINYMLAYDGTGTFSFNPGKAFWITSTSAVSISRTVPSVPLNYTGGYDIPVHPGGWTLISNPFEREVSWASVLSKNGLPSNTALWDWNGSWAYASALQPGKGYYYFDVTGSASTLNIPYPLFQPEIKSAGITRQEKSFRLLLLDNGKVISSVVILFSDGAATGFDQYDIPMPPGDFETASVRIGQATGTSTGRHELFTDARTLSGEGNAYRILLKNGTGRELTLVAQGLEQFPGLRARLVSTSMPVSADLDGGSGYKVFGGKDECRLYFGNSKYVNDPSRQSAAADPGLFTCVPNPATNASSLRFMLDAEAHVTIDLFDPAGRDLGIIYDGTAGEGFHQVPLNISHTVAGVVTCRMRIWTDKDIEEARYLRIVVLK